MKFAKRKRFCLISSFAKQLIKFNKYQFYFTLMTLKRLQSEIQCANKLHQSFGLIQTVMQV